MRCMLMRVITYARARVIATRYAVQARAGSLHYTAYAGHIRAYMLPGQRYAQ